MAGSVIDFKLTGDSADVINAYNKILNKQKKTIDNLKKQGRASKKAGQDAKDSLRGTEQSLVGALAKFNLLSKAIELTAGAFKKLSEERKKALEGLKAQTAPIQQLLQLSGGDKKEFQRLVRATEKTRLETGLSASESANLQFTLESLGLGGKRALFAQTSKVTSSAPEFATGIGTLLSAFGAKEAGTPEQLINKLLKASAESKTTIGQFAPAATISAQQARTIGATDEELLAILAITSRSAKSADVASTRIAALADVIFKKGLGGEGFLAAIPKLQEQIQGLTPKETIEFFGRKEARVGLAQIQLGKEDIERLVQKIGEVGLATGTKADLFQNMLAIRRATPLLFEPTEAKKAGQQALLSLEQRRGVEEAKRKRFSNQLEGIRNNLFDQGKIVQGINFRIAEFITNRTSFFGLSAENQKSFFGFLQRGETFETQKGINELNVQIKNLNDNLLINMVKLIGVNEGQEKAQIKTADQAEKATDLKEVNVSEKTD